VAQRSRNDIYDSAVAFAHEWKDDTSERSEAQTFWTEFLEVFGVRRRRVKAAFERDAIRTSTGRPGRIDLLWPGMLLAEHKSAGEDLDEAMGQALDYVDSLSDVELPRLIVASDFQHFCVLDLDDPSEVAEFPLQDLPRQIDRFLVLAGYTSRRFDDEDAVDIQAAEILGKVYDELDATGYTGHQLRVFLVRLLFLLFGDSTGLWPRRAWADLIVNRTAEDGSDLGMWIGHLFSVLDTEVGARSTAIDDDLADFPYVNGGLFAERIEPPDTNRSIRARMLEATHFDWSQISPAVFGAMFQSIMDRQARRAIGAHYTSERNIMKVIEPLFLDELQSELAACGSSSRRLQNFLNKLGTLTFFDPACGCGNFLVIAYRELRRLESEALVRLHGHVVQLTHGLEQWRTVQVDQFYGIEIEEFPARIAETAVYLVDHLENERLSKAFGQNLIDLPLEATATIAVGNALEMDWNSLIPDGPATYVYGNPPFIGKKARTPSQKEDMTRVFSGGRNTAELDYVAAWYEVARKYVRSTTSKVAFVSTSSIVQGEQVPILWPRLLDNNFELGFAHRPFSWSSEARGAAQVSVVIIGWQWGKWTGTKRLFDYPDPKGQPIETSAKQINPYLADFPTLYVTGRRTPLGNVPKATFGSMPNDGGHLIFGDEEAEQLRADTHAAPFVRQLASTRQMLRNQKRWCLWLADSTANERRASAEICKRVDAVRAYRLESKRQATKQLADTPYLFGEIRQPTEPYLCIPRHTSENRNILPMLFMPSSVIASDSTIAIPGADEYLFGILQSSMFAVWLESIGGRLDGRLRFSVEVVYNTFPFPDASPTQRARIQEAAREVLAAREAEPESSLVDLYDPEATPAALVAAHRRLDQAVISAFVGGRRTLTTDTDRLVVLFERYLQMVEAEGQLPSPSTRARRK
jgi:hypothetical protein